MKGTTKNYHALYRDECLFTEFSEKILEQSKWDHINIFLKCGHSHSWYGSHLCASKKQMVLI